MTTTDVCAQTPDDERRTTNDEHPTTNDERTEIIAYVERRHADLRQAIIDYVVSSQRELRDQIGMLQAQIADLSAQLEETSAMVLRLEKQWQQP